MVERLPPLNALRTFEAAARHLSFTKAAEELFVTQAAVSHQIKALEEHLGVKLFRRRNRTLVLTEEGQALLPSVRDGFALLALGVRRLRERAGRGTLTISVMPSFGAHWLVGRLGRFQAAHPEIDVRVTTTPRLVDFAREDVDVAIRYGRGDWPGLRCERLLTEEIFPVCSPRLMEGPHPLRRPEDLAHHTLLHVLHYPDDWRLWLRAAGVSTVDPERGPRFEIFSLALQAAIQGVGVAVARGALAAEDLRAGRLVAPFDLELPSECAYHFVVPEATADQPKIRAFRDWLFEEAAASAASPTRLLAPADCTRPLPLSR